MSTYFRQRRVSSSQVVSVGRNDDRAADDVGDLDKFVDKFERRSTTVVGDDVTEIADVTLVVAVDWTSVTSWPRVVVVADAIIFFVILIPKKKSLQ